MIKWRKWNNWLYAIIHQIMSFCLKKSSSAVTVKWLIVQIFTYFMHLQQMDESHQISWSKVTRLNELVAHAQILCNQYVGEGDVCFIYCYCLIYCSQMFFHCFTDWKQLKPQYLYGGVVVCSAYCNSVEILQSISGNHMINLTEIEEIL